LRVGEEGFGGGGVVAEFPELFFYLVCVCERERERKDGRRRLWCGGEELGMSKHPEKISMCVCVCVYAVYIYIHPYIHTFCSHSTENGIIVPPPCASTHS
jgi:hypothetical protein